MTDIAAILDGARSGKLSLIIMQHDTIGNQVLNSAAVCGVENGCPILCLSHLRQQLSLVLRNPLLKAVAFRVGGIFYVMGCFPLACSYIKSLSKGFYFNTNIYICTHN